MIGFHEFADLFRHETQAEIAYRDGDESNIVWFTKRGGGHHTFDKSWAKFEEFDIDLASRLEMSSVLLDACQCEAIGETRLVEISIRFLDSQAVILGSTQGAEESFAENLRGIRHLENFQDHIRNQNVIPDPDGVQKRVGGGFITESHHTELAQRKIELSIETALVIFRGTFFDPNSERGGLPVVKNIIFRSMEDRIRGDRLVGMHQGRRE
jgi:hypothetical protein